MAHEVGVTVTYGLLNAQRKETPYLLWNPSVLGDIGMHLKCLDARLSLEHGLDFISTKALVEVTTQNLRMSKRKN